MSAILLSLFLERLFSVFISFSPIENLIDFHFFGLIYFFLIFLLFQSRLLFFVPWFLLSSEVSYMRDWFLAETSTSRFRISSDYVLMSERDKKPEVQVVTEVWSCFWWTFSQSGDDSGFLLFILLWSLMKIVYLKNTWLASLSKMTSSLWNWLLFSLIQRDKVKWACVTLNEGYLRAANRGSKNLYRFLIKI